ncbi:glycosyltransferase [Maribacter sp. 2308TA10-17]|uniref:glycosyltransferase n=1 Tax=Maribacter sp. 2308TA10-17 TaxID=3386276 RepID=UPI0039BD02CF
MTPTPIVVVAFNRPKCLQRILNSLGNANYLGLDVPLFISVDFSENNNEVLAVANDFTWKYGEKKVLSHKVNLGLKKHVLKCGSLALEHGSIIVLEDDLLVAPSFYSFALEALEFTADKNYVGGISLYNHQTNVQTLTNFSPIEDGFDNWYFQFASSWGQAWSKKQWKQFLNWYESEPDLNSKPNIPAKVLSWSEKSWLKFNVAYLIEENKYFLYPKVSLTTNFSEVGTHNPEESTAFQVPMRFGVQNKFTFSSLDESFSTYDAFYENMNLSKHLNIQPKDLCVCLYGYKPTANKKKFLITSKKLNFKIVKSFGQSLKPIDANILLNILGDDLFLYNLDKPESNKFKNNRESSILYNTKIIVYKDLYYLFYKSTGKKIKSLFKKLAIRKT